MHDYAQMLLLRICRIEPENISSKTFAVVLQAFKKAGAPVEHTHQHSEGFNLFCEEQAVKLWIGT